MGTSVCPPEARVSASPWPVQGRLGSLPLPSTRNWDDGWPVTVPQGRREPPGGGRPGEGQGGRGGRELRPSCERLHGHERACPHLHRWQGLGDGVEGLLPQEGGGPGGPADGEGQGRLGDGPGGHGLQGRGGWVGRRGEGQTWASGAETKLSRRKGNRTLREWRGRGWGLAGGRWAVGVRRSELGDEGAAGPLGIGWRRLGGVTRGAGLGCGLTLGAGLGSARGGSGPSRVQLVPAGVRPGGCWARVFSS